MTGESEMAEVSLFEDAGRQERKEAFIELRARGYSLERCSKLIKVAKATLCNWSHELEEEIARELERVYVRQKAGLISSSQAEEEPFQISSQP